MHDISPSPGLKRGLDLVLSAVLLVVTAPLLMALVILVRLTSSGPAIYTQTRIGRERRQFTIFKIRTMYHDCERLSGPRWSTENDPRVTPVGGFLRRTHLDELPQLWNILRGDMSLVGPRPERPEFVEPLEKALPRYGERLKALPGVTGLAQVSLPPDSDHESVRRKLELDLHYVENQSLWLDLRLLACTGLFLAGVPFTSAVRLFGLRTWGADRPAQGTVEVGSGIEIRHQAVPAWRDS